MVRELPQFIDLRRDRITGTWLFICRACGIIERYSKFWPASRAAWDHADIELMEQENERIGGS